MSAASGGNEQHALVDDINRTRAELGDTVEALVAKVDVKARAQQRVADVSTQARQRVAGVSTQARGKLQAAWDSAPEPVQRGARRVAQTVDQHRAPAAAAAVGAVLLAGWLAVRRRRR